jgi:hypothetical protein
LSTSEPKASAVRKIFTSRLTGRPKGKTQVHFTIKFRAGSDSEWKWAHSHFSHGDGLLLYQPEFAEHDLPYFIRGLNSHVEYKTVVAQTPETQLWSLTASVEAAEGDESGQSTHRLGVPTSFSRWFALVRLWSPWLAPRQGNDKFTPDKEAVLAAFLRDDGLHVAILAISGIDDVLTLLTSDSSGSVLIHGRNDAESAGTSRVLIAVAKSFEIANAAVMYEARQMVMSIESGPREAELIALEKENGVKPQWLEEWADGFAFCTWNSLGQKLTEEKIYEALDSLRKNDIEITNLIIDDLWQSVDHPGAEQYVRGSKPLCLDLSEVESLMLQ